jgi:hypothetical protein
MLVRLLYASRAAAPVTPELIDTLLAQARLHNPARGITGVLCHCGDAFMQVLEGGRGEVNALYARIARDPRHREATVLQFEEIGERRFSAWTMGHVNMAKVNPSIALKYGEMPQLDPFSVSGQASMALLEELVATAAIVGRAG